MATNPMKRRNTMAFLGGMLVMLLIAALVVMLLFNQIKSKDEELEQYRKNIGTVYVLNQDVISGQVLTASMFTQQKVSLQAIPSNAIMDLSTEQKLLETKLMDTEGNSINAPSGDRKYYYYRFEGQNRDSEVYVGDNQYATSLKAGDKIYYYKGENKEQRVEAEIAQVDGIIAKVDMKANTVITKDLLSVSNEATTDDLRKTEYNIISLPVDLQPEEYIDIRLVLPNGQNYIVVSKKKVSIPMVNGAYLPDTIQLNLTEEEILIISCAIVENYQIEGSKLEAVRYIEAGLQEAATMTYWPNNAVQQLIINDPNLTAKAIQGIREKRESIRNEINSTLNTYKSENDEEMKTKVEESITATQDARKKYLESLTQPAETQY